MINTKQAPRRELSFSSLGDLKAELDRLDAAHAAGNLENTGNWKPAEIYDHLGRFWTCSLDGFPAGKLPLPLRLLGRFVFKKGAISGSQPPPGFKIPKGAEHFLPRDGVTYEQGAEALRTCIERVEKGDSYVPESPLFGKLTRDQWTTIHLGHCAMHLSFLDPKS